jgi:DNA-directed RNA polymerase beta subunit
MLFDGKTGEPFDEPVTVGREVHVETAPLSR